MFNLFKSRNGGFVVESGIAIGLIIVSVIFLIYVIYKWSNDSE